MLFLKGQDGNIRTDDKGPILAALYGLKAVKDTGLKLMNRVRVLFGTNEESGFKCIEYYLKHGGETPVAGFTPDAEYPVIRGEKGTIVFNATKRFEKRSHNSIVVKYIQGGEASNIVPAHCKCELMIENRNLRESTIKKFDKFVSGKKYQMNLKKKDNILILKSTGVAVHAMNPEKGKNAIMQLITFLDTIDLGSSDTAAYIHFLAKNIGMETNGNSLGIKCKDDTGELTLNVGIIDLNEDRGIVTINPRYPYTFKEIDIMEKINTKAKPIGIKLELLMEVPALYFPADHPLIKILMKVFEEQTNQKAFPLSIGGGTYAKAMPNIVGFGPLFPGEPVVEHEPNEYFKIKDLILNANIYAHAIYELAKRDW